MPRTRIVTRSRSPYAHTSEKRATIEPSAQSSPQQRSQKSTADKDCINHRKHTCPSQRSRHTDNWRANQKHLSLIIKPSKCTINKYSIVGSSLDACIDTSRCKLDKYNQTLPTGRGYLSDKLRHRCNFQGAGGGSIDARVCENVSDKLRHMCNFQGAGGGSIDARVCENVSDSASKSSYLSACNHRTTYLSDRKGNRTFHGTGLYFRKAVKDFGTGKGKEQILVTKEGVRADKQDESLELSAIYHSSCAGTEDILSDRWDISSQGQNIRINIGILPSCIPDIHRYWRHIGSDSEDIRRHIGSDSEDILDDIGHVVSNRDEAFSDRDDFPQFRQSILCDSGDTAGDSEVGTIHTVIEPRSSLCVVNVLREPLNISIANSDSHLSSTLPEKERKHSDTCTQWLHAGYQVFPVHKPCCTPRVISCQRCSPSNCEHASKPEERVTPGDGEDPKSAFSGQVDDTLDRGSSIQSSSKEKEQTVSPRDSTSESTDTSAMASVFIQEMEDIPCVPSDPPHKKWKKRRRSKRAPAAKANALFLTPTEDTPLDDLTHLSHSSTHDHDESEAPSQPPSCSTDQATVSKTSFLDRLRICSSPNFIYDPGIASQIPFYFKNPEVEEAFLEHDSLWSGISQRRGSDTSSEFSWDEFDSDHSLNDTCVIDGTRVQDELSTGVHYFGEGVSHSTKAGTGSQESISCVSAAGSIDSLTEDSEIDYDSYLPAHVLMHVKRDLVSVLMEYGQTREVKVSFQDMERSGPHHASRFHTAAVVDNETFPVGSGSSKKNAKKAAAAQALKIMYDRGRKNLEAVNDVAHKKLNVMPDEEVGSHAHRVVLVSRHVLDTAEETQFINYSKDKIAATFVLEYHGRMRVVGLGTGNRCMLYQHLTLDGKRIIHSHAEIIARRAFLRYLYKQLLTYNGNRSHPIFTRSDTGKLKLRDKIQVHLYISRPPCGDAAAFPTISNFPNKMRAIRKQGQLRTIIDDGEGAIPTDFPVPAGANGKERLRIMTCSDKICRWNVLGVQGAMLSNFIDPIYISSLVIGSHTGDQRGHVPRAVSGRLKCGRLHEVIQRPYHINTPDIHYPHDDLADNYNITKSKQYCITWSYGDVDAEVIDAITGVTNMESMEDVIPSRVAKITLYGLFQQVCNKYGQQDLAGLDYLSAKRAATTFQRMKSFVGQHLAAMGFGQWYSLQDTYGTDSLTCPGPC